MYTCSWSFKLSVPKNVTQDIDFMKDFLLPFSQELAFIARRDYSKIDPIIDIKLEINNDQIEHTSVILSHSHIERIKVEAIIKTDKMETAETVFNKFFSECLNRFKMRGTDAEILKNVKEPFSNDFFSKEKFPELLTRENPRFLFELQGFSASGSI